MGLRDIIVSLRLNNRDYNTGLEQSGKKTKSFANDTTTAIKKAALAYVSLSGSVALVKKVVSETAALQTARVKWEVLTKSVDEADKKIKSIFEFSNRTPFTFKGVEKAASNIYNLTDGMLDGNLALERLGDRAAKANVKMSELSIWWGRMYSNMQSGRPIGEAMARMQELGVISGSLRNKLEGLSKSEMVSKGWQTFIEGTKNADGMMQKLSMTIAGKLSTLQGVWDGMFALDDKNIEAQIAGVIQFAIDALNNFKSTFQDTIKNIVNFGVSFINGNLFKTLKEFYNEVSNILKASFSGWVLLWDNIIKPVLDKTLRGWRMIFTVATTALKNIQVIFENIGEIATDVFQIATLQIELMIAKATSKIKPLLTYVKTYLETGNFQTATNSARAEEKLGDANIYRANKNLANYETSGATDKVVNTLNKNMSELGEKLINITQESLFAPMVEKQEAIKEKVTATNDKIADVVTSTGEKVKQDTVNYLALSYDAAKEAHAKAYALAVEAAKKAEANRQRMLSITANAMSGVNNAYNAFMNTSLNTFGQLMSAGGGFSGLIDMFAPGVGQVVSGATGLLGNIFGQKEEEEASSSSVGVSALADDKPSATITKTADTINNYWNINQQNGVILGDPASLTTAAQIMKDEMSGLAGVTG